MDETQTKRPWWRKKRWRLAALLWFSLIAYPLAAPPLGYAQHRGWISVGTFRGILKPVMLLTEVAPPSRRPLIRYIVWWQELGIQHAQRYAAPKRPPTYVPDPAVNRTHWRPPVDDGINRTHWTPAKTEKP